MARNRNEIDRLAGACGLEAFPYLPTESEEMQALHPYWQAWADRVELLASTPALWTDPLRHAQAVEAANAFAYAGYVRPLNVQDTPGASLSWRGRRCNYWTFVRAFDRFERENRLSEGILPVVKAPQNPEGPLVIVVHPGDLVERLRAGAADVHVTAEAMQGQARDIGVAMLDGADAAVLHGRSSLLLLREWECSEQLMFQRAIQSIMDNGSLAWARKMEAAARWILDELSGAQRCYILLAGTNAEPGRGPTAVLGALLEAAGARVRVSDFVMGNRGTYDGCWAPKNWPRMRPGGATPPVADAAPAEI